MIPSGERIYIFTITKTACMQHQPQQKIFADPLTKNQIDYKSVYTSCFPMVRSMVLKHGGTTDDARDIFQDSILVLFQNSAREQFHLTVSNCTYLYSIARNKWLKHVRDTGKITSLEMSGDHSDGSDGYYDDQKRERQRLLVKHLNLLNDRCRKILKHFFEGVPGEEIAQTMDFSSYEYYRVAKNRCTEGLKQSMQKDRAFNELM